MSTSTKLQVGAALVALLVVSFMVMRVSSAAFSATTETSGNWTAGTVALSDDDGAGSTVFTNDTAMVPGDTDQACITVTYDGDVDTAGVRLYGATTFGGASDLGDHLTLTVEIVDLSSGTCASPAGVTSTLFSGSDLSASAGSFTDGHADWSTGLSTGWSPTGGSGDSRVFRFTLQLQDDDAAQGLDTTATFTWETQNA